MTEQQAQQELARPLVFGDELQIAALKILVQRPKDHVLEQARDLLSDCIYNHKDTECWITLEQTADFLAELQSIVGNPRV